MQEKKFACVFVLNGGDNLWLHLLNTLHRAPNTRGQVKPHDPALPTGRETCINYIAKTWTCNRAQYMSQNSEGV